MNNKNTWRVIALTSIFINLLIIGVGYYYILRPLNRLRNLEANTQQLCELYDPNSSNIGSIINSLGLAERVEVVCE